MNTEAGVARFRQTISRLLVVEVGLILLVSIGGTLISTAAGMAVFLGGMVYWVPKSLFTVVSLRRLGRQPPEAIVASVIMGTIGKALIMGALLVLVIQYVSGLPVPVFMMALGGFYLSGLVLTAFILAVP